MSKITEDVFAAFNTAGAFRGVSLVLLDDQHAHIGYETNTGLHNVIHTARGQPKDYRIDTALKFLRGLGILNVTADLAKIEV